MRVPLGYQVQVILYEEYLTDDGVRQSDAKRDKIVVETTDEEVANKVYLAAINDAKEAPMSAYTMDVAEEEAQERRRGGRVPVTVPEAIAPSTKEGCTERRVVDDRRLSPGGGPTRATTLPTDNAERKKRPIASGVLDYFPDAIVAVSEVSDYGNRQHNPGMPLQWTRNKSGDHADTLMRHMLQRGTRDSDGLRHSAKVVWRALAMLQEEIEKEQADAGLFSKSV